MDKVYINPGLHNQIVIITNDPDEIALINNIHATVTTDEIRMATAEISSLTDYIYSVSDVSLLHCLVATSVPS